jgi:glycerol uptake facilitator-like aquaporin
VGHIAEAPHGPGERRWFSWSDIWIYLVADLAGGAVAALTFLYLNPGDGRTAGS